MTPAPPELGQPPELTILLLCLNEAETLEGCLRAAASFLSATGTDGEILLSDNGSTDDSPALARGLGVRVIDVPQRGYGAAAIAGTRAAQGKYVIMGDTDGSHDLAALSLFLERLRAGDDLVIGNRFKGGIAPRSMPLLNRRVGTPFLSLLARLLYGVSLGDVNCGLRGYRREAILALGLRATGMAYASEMIAEAARSGLKISEVPTKMFRAGRSRAPHLRRWRDGWEHLALLVSRRFSGCEAAPHER